jgi:hypothetical protein
MRILIKAIILLSAPTVLLAQGTAIHFMATTAPWWLTAVVLGAHAVALFGFASLVDRRRPPPPL